MDNDIEFVPEFHHYELIPPPTSSSSGFSRHKKPPQGGEFELELEGDDNIMELMWQQNGPVVKKSSLHRGGGEAAAAAEIQSINEAQNQQQNNNNNNLLFMEEDEMSSWLLHQYPIDDNSTSSLDLLYSAPPPPPPPQPPANPPPICLEKPEIRPHNFGYFSRIPARPIPMPPARDSNNNDATAAEVKPPEARVSHTAVPPNCTAQIGTSAAGGELDRRKRKATEAADDKEYCQSQSEDIEFEAGHEPKKLGRGSVSGSGTASTKRSRASEVHNLSERRRRDRINEKMKALQELIPRCNKVDKASMLDEAIEYLKSLQMQVQMMSMGCGMIPMMYPGMHQYMPAMSMGMGMGMGMDMGMNRPMHVPYPSMMPGSSTPNPAAAAHMGHTFPMPPFHMPPMRLPDPSRIQASNQPDPMLHSLVAQNPNQPQLPNFVDPYQQFIGLHQAQIPLPQNQVVMQPSASAPSTSKETFNPDHRQTE